MSQKTYKILMTLILLLFVFTIIYGLIAILGYAPILPLIVEGCILTTVSFVFMIYYTIKAWK